MIKTRVVALFFVLYFMGFNAFAVEPSPLTAHFVAGVGFKVPAAWKRQSPSSAMRRIQYEIPAAEGEKEPATFAVFYFGPGEGGLSASNVARWHSQFTEAPAGFTPEIYGGSVDDLKVSTVHFEGTYRDPMAGVSEPKRDFAMLGAIIEGPEGPIFFKLTGPRASILSARPAFDLMIRSIRRSKLGQREEGKKKAL